MPAEPMQPDRRSTIHQARIALRRALLLAARDPSFVQDKIDCAEIALTLGLNDVARAMYDMAFIRSGFAPARLGWQAEIARRTGLWETPFREDDGKARPTDFSLDIAIGELRALLATEDRIPPLPAHDADLVGDRAQALEPAGLARRAPDGVNGTVPAATLTPKLSYARTPATPPTPVPPAAVIFPLSAALCTLLRAAWSPATAGALHGLLGRIRTAFVDVPPFDAIADIDDPSRLAAACIAADLRHFLLTNHALAYPPLGSGEVFHAAARQDPAGLGPYLRNVPRLLRDARDLLGCLQLAAGGAPDADVSARWLPLLATNLDERMLQELVDELGDRGLMRPIWAILSTTISQSGLRRDRGLVWRVRDAGLDNGDLALAACAQRVVASWAVDDKTEWRILGEIHATVGAFEEAEHAFQIAWSMAPKDDFLASRIQSLIARDVASFAVTRGFGTPEWRQRRRFGRQRTSRMRSLGLAAIRRGP